MDGDLLPLLAGMTVVTTMGMIEAEALTRGQDIEALTAAVVVVLRGLTRLCLQVEALQGGVFTKP